MRRKIFTLALMVLTLIFATTAFAGANFQLSSYTLTSLGNYQLQFRGRSWNANNLNEITGIHVYVGGGVGAGGQMIGEFRTDRNHNFDATLSVPQNRSGNQLVVIYAVNGIESKELDRRYINILSNNRKADFRLDSYDLTSPSNYQLRFRGRSWNESNRSEITGIHVYIGGGVGAGGQMIGEFRTDRNHNFDATLNVPQNRSGNQLVVIYAVNGIESKELDRRNINILPNNENWDFKVGQKLANENSNSYKNPPNPFTKSYTSSKDGSFHSTNCTWYAWGRMREVTGKEITFSGGSKNGGEWHLRTSWDNNLTSKCVAERSGHVAFVEHVDENKGKVYYTEVNWNIRDDYKVQVMTIANFRSKFKWFIH